MLSSTWDVIVHFYIIALVSSLAVPGSIPLRNSTAAI